VHFDVMKKRKDLILEPDILLEGGPAEMLNGGIEGKRECLGKKKEHEIGSGRRGPRFQWSEKHLTKFAGINQGGGGNLRVKGKT